MLGLVELKVLNQSFHGLFRQTNSHRNTFLSTNVLETDYEPRVAGNRSGDSAVDRLTPTVRTPRHQSRNSSRRTLCRATWQ